MADPDTAIAPITPEDAPDKPGPPPGNDTEPLSVTKSRASVDHLATSDAPTSTEPILPPQPGVTTQNEPRDVTMEELTPVPVGDEETAAVPDAAGEGILQGALNEGHVDPEKAVVDAQGPSEGAVENLPSDASAPTESPVTETQQGDQIGEQQVDTLQTSLDNLPPPSPPPPMPDATFIPQTARTLQSPPPSDDPFKFINVDYTRDAEGDGTGVEVVTTLSRPGSAFGGDESAETERKANVEAPPILLPTSPTPLAPVAAAEVAVDTLPKVTADQQYEKRVEGGVDREEIIAKIKAGLEEKDRLRLRNVALQNKLGEYFRRKKTDEGRDGDPKPATDLTARYASSLSTLLELHTTLQNLHSTHEKLSSEYHTRLSGKQAEASEKFMEFKAYKRGVAMAAENSRTGKGIPVKMLEGLEANEDRKEAELWDVRLENIKLRNRLKRSESLLRQKEELADGLHLIDFEQLKIENSTYTSKIEARNEDLLKLRKKITTIVQVLTHVKEKLHYVTHETRDSKEELEVLDDEVMRRRDELPGRKGERDRLRNGNAELRKRAGLLGEVGLLRDFEQRVDETQELQSKIDKLRMQHGEYQADMLSVKRKIQKAQIVSGSIGVM